MGVKAAIGRVIAAPLLLFNLFCAIIILGLAGRVLDRGISNGGGILSSGFGGNGATPYFVIFSLIAAVVAIASYLAGIHHLRLWRANSGSGAQSAAWIAWLLLIIAFCLAWKQIHYGGTSTKLKVLEAFVIILTLTHFLYTLVLHKEDKYNQHDNNGVYNNNATTGNKGLNPNAPAAASAV